MSALSPSFSNLYLHLVVDRCSGQVIGRNKEGQFECVCGAIFKSSDELHDHLVDILPTLKRHVAEAAIANG